MNRVEINYELTQLREERGKLEVRLKNIELCMKALTAMRKSLDAKEPSLHDEMFGG